MITKRNSRSLKMSLALLAVWVCAPGSRALAAPLSTGADFLLMTTGARPDGMGQAFSAVADDINTLSSNPAGLGNIRLPEIGYGYESFLAGIDYNFLGAAVPMGGAGVLGLGYISMGTAPFNSTTNPSAAPGTALDQALIGGWGRSFYDLHVGFAAKYIMRELDGAHGNGFGFDLGLRYRPLPALTLAASAMNLGRGIQLASLEPLPTLLNVGVAWTPLEEADHTLTLALNGSSYIASNTQSLGAGVEYWYRDAFALRGGYQANSRDTAFNTNGLSAGAGVKFSFFQIDYAFQPFNNLGVVHRISGLLRWDGPWAAGGEPNPPKYVNVLSSPYAMDIRWERPQGSAQAYQVVLQPLNGEERILSPVVTNPIFRFKNYEPGTIYKISVLTLNEGSRSFPSNEVYLMAPFHEELPPAMAEGGHGSFANWVQGSVDGVGLHLSWKAVPDSEGYEIYRQSPAGRIVKVTQVPRRANQVWLTDTSGLEGSKWYVATLSDGGRREMALGFYLWYPTPKEVEFLAQTPLIKLHTEEQPGHRMFLDWTRDEGAQGYSVFIGEAQDGVLEFYKDYPADAITALLKLPKRKNKVTFLVAPISGGGERVQRSNEISTEFFKFDPSESF